MATWQTLAGSDGKGAGRRIFLVKNGPLTNENRPYGLLD